MMLPAWSACAPAALSETPQQPSPLPVRLAGMVATYEAGVKAVVGMSVVDLRTGQPLADVRAGELRTPASNQKLLTSAMAMANLGADFKFTTEVYLRGNDLLVVGGYDPTLGDPLLAEANNTTIYAELDRWAAAVKTAVGGTLRGDVLVGVVGEPAGYRHPDWPAGQYSQWYCAPVTNVAFSNNCVNVAFQADANGIAPQITPASRFIRVDSSKVQLGASSRWDMQSNADDSVLTLKGKVANGKSFPISVAIDDPPILLGRVLADRLLQAGVKFTGKIRTVPMPLLSVREQPVCRTETPLGDVMARANKRSLNMAAESIFLRAGDGTWRGSAAIMTRTLIAQFGLKQDQFTIADGSGMSRNNAVAPSAVTTLLACIAARPDAAVLVDSLPVAGEDGTLKKRLTAKARGQIVAKTGYINNVSCLSGYVLDENDKPVLAFSILVNDIPMGQAWKAKQLQDAICRELVEYLGK